MGRENGWYLKVDGFMSEFNYQRIWPTSACDALYDGTSLTFVLAHDGRPVKTVTYVQTDEPLKLQRENEKLRDAVQLMYDVLVSGTVDPCQICDMLGTCENHPAPPQCKYSDSADVSVAALLDFLRELGIEVSE